MSSLSAACATSAPIDGDRNPFGSFHPSLNPKSRFVFSKPSKLLCVKASSNPNYSISQTLQSTAASALLLSATAAALLTGAPFRARAEQPVTAEEQVQSQSHGSALSEFLESNAGDVGSLRELLYQKLDDGEGTEALTILNHLISAQPDETEWKFLAAWLHNEMGNRSESRRFFEEILAVDPLSFEALFANAVLMYEGDEGEAVIERLERALDLARAEHKGQAARDVRLIMAQIQYLQKNVDAALASYEELAKEDPKDYRPYFCQGVIYSLLARNKEAREKFAKYHELSPKKFQVNGYLQTPLSRVKLFGTGQSEL
ncbi:putative tetratricopeptide-like helical domain superfamily [Dioscorea sansibarensis]